MKKKELDNYSNKIVKAFLKNKIIKPLPIYLTKKISNAQKFRKLCESKVKEPIIGFKAAGTAIAVIKKLGEKEPFYAATYIPKEAQMGRLGLRQILRGIHGMWTNEQARVRKAIEQITQGYSQYTSYSIGSFPDENALKKAQSYFSLHADPNYGGFGKAPKFPSPHQLVFLCREWYQHQDSELLESVILS